MSEKGVSDGEFEEILSQITGAGEKGDGAGISSIISMLSGVGGTKETGANTKKTAIQTPNDRRIALLCALRPYLNPQRQATVDKILQFARLGSIMGKLTK